MNKLYHLNTTYTGLVVTTLCGEQFNLRGSRLECIHIEHYIDGEPYYQEYKRDNLLCEECEDLLPVVLLNQ